MAPSTASVDEPQHHDRPEQSADARRAAPLDREQRDDHAQRHRQHRAFETADRARSRPSTALSTEIAGVINASQ